MVKHEEQHNCSESMEVRRATIEKPYHFIDSGLDNVYLVGVRYFVCQKCGKQSAEIPAVGGLMRAIARSLVKKESPLTGPEIRFLRKRLGKKAIDFAKIVDRTPEQVSRWENGPNLPDKGIDSFIRMYYDMLSGDKLLGKQSVPELDAWFSAPRDPDVKQEDIRAALRNHQWQTATA